MREAGVRVENMGPGDLVECRMKLLLGLIWTLMNHFQVSMAAKRVESADSDAARDKTGGKLNQTQLILRWFELRCQMYPDKQIPCKRWSDFSNGMPLLAALHATDPALAPGPAAWNPAAAEDNVEQAIDTLTRLGVPRLLEVCWRGG